MKIYGISSQCDVMKVEIQDLLEKVNIKQLLNYNGQGLTNFKHICYDSDKNVLFFVIENPICDCCERPKICGYFKYNFKLFIDLIPSTWILIYVFSC